MIQQKRFGRRLGVPSTVQIMRELKAMMRRDADAAALARVEDADTAPAQIGAATSTDFR